MLEFSGVVNACTRITGSMALFSLPSAGFVCRMSISLEVVSTTGMCSSYKGIVWLARFSDTKLIFIFIKLSSL